MNQFKRIFIIGHPGAGKALLGKILAEQIGWKFIDADFGLEIHIGRTLSEILGKKGNESFHHCEAKILDSFLTRENIVITTDSGVICNEKNRKILSSEFTVYLKVSTAVQLERTLRNPDPLLLDTEMRTFLDKLHEERDDLYDQVATLTVDGDNSALDEHVCTILNNFNLNKDDTILDSLVLEKKDVIFFHKITHMPVHLSAQQALCLKFLSQGKSSKEIAKIMNISYRTVEGYIAKTAEVLGCSSSKELIYLYHNKP